MYDPLVSRTLATDAPATRGRVVVADTHPTASRVPPAGRLQQSPAPGALACPVCGEVPSPARMPRRAPGWLRRLAVRRSHPGFAYGVGWAR